jgi:hypothetical protein
VHCTRKLCPASSNSLIRPGILNDASVFEKPA